VLFVREIYVVFDGGGVDVVDGGGNAMRITIRMKCRTTIGLEISGAELSHVCISE